MSFVSRLFATVIGGLIVLHIAQLAMWVRYPVDTQERVYYMRYGGIYCSHRELTPCGYRLSMCANANIYECITDIHWEDK